MRLTIGHIHMPDKWITAEEFEEQVAQAKAMQLGAHADREFYDPDNEVRTLFNNTGFWYPQTEEKRDYSGERG